MNCPLVFSSRTASQHFSRVVRTAAMIGVVGSVSQAPAATPPTLVQQSTLGLGTMVPARTLTDLQFNVTGTAPVTVQWQRNGVDIPGGTHHTGCRGNRASVSAACARLHPGAVHCVRHQRRGHERDCHE
jgi:hypothetical protein